MALPQKGAATGRATARPRLPTAAVKEHAMSKRSHTTNPSRISRRRGKLAGNVLPPSPIMGHYPSVVCEPCIIKAAAAIERRKLRGR
jgi:hypothetical protein